MVKREAKRVGVDEVEYALNHPEEGLFPRIDGDGTSHLDQYDKCPKCKGVGWIKPSELLEKELREILGEDDVHKGNGG